MFVCELYRIIMAVVDFSVRDLISAFYAHICGVKYSIIFVPLQADALLRVDAMCTSSKAFKVYT